MIKQQQMLGYPRKTALDYGSICNYVVCYEAVKEVVTSFTASGVSD